MLFTNFSFIGIDPTAGTKPFTYAALDQDRNLIALSSGSMEDVLAFVGGQQAAIVAVNAPYSPNNGLMNSQEVRETLNPQPRPGRWMNLRMVEYELRMLGIGVFSTPSNKGDCPRWMQSGFTFYRHLERIGYFQYPASDKSHQWIEIHPHASFTVLLESQPLNKHTIEGRLQRQLLLSEEGLGITDPMNFFEEITRYRLLKGILPYDQVYTAEELDAIMAAYSAYIAANNPDRVTMIGNRDEGQILLPVNEVKSKY